MNFQLGNQRQQKRIAKEFLSGKAPHALLISGPKDIGKFSFLKTLSSKLLEGKSLPPQQVLVDELYMEGVHDNLEELSQSSSFNQIHRKKKRTKSDSLGIDDVESCTKHLHETVSGKYKIVCIRDIERMTIAASNKFLKILEEPPQKTIFFLTTSAPQKLLPTITSRCRMEYFSLLSPQEIYIEISQSEKFFTDNEKKLLTILSSGKSKELVKMMNDDEYLASKKELYIFVEKLIKETPLEKMNTAEIYAKKPLSKIFQLLEMFLLVLREYLLQDSSSVSNLDAVDNAIIALQGNGNKRMVLERLFLIFS